MSCTLVPVTILWYFSLLQVETTLSLLSPVGMATQGEGQADVSPTHCLVEEEYTVSIPLVGVKNCIPECFRMWMS